MLPPQDESGMQIVEVLAVLAELRSTGCRVWVAGGWSVDALVGLQTRAHRDLDLAVDAENQLVAMRVLERRGYRVETDWWPVRVELAAEDRGWVDLHPVVFDAAGHGRQADLDGQHFDYPAEAFDIGVLNGVAVPCLSRQQQVRFHTGYPPREVDLHDLRLLEGFQTALPRLDSDTAGDREVNVPVVVRLSRRRVRAVTHLLASVAPSMATTLSQAVGRMEAGSWVSTSCRPRPHSISSVG